MRQIYSNLDEGDRKPYRTVEEIQEEFGRPYLDVFLDFLNKYQDVKLAAAALNFSWRQLYRYTPNFQKVCRWEYKPGIVVVNKE